MSGPLYKTPETVQITVTDPGSLDDRNSNRPVWRFKAVIPGVDPQNNYSQPLSCQPNEGQYLEKDEVVNCLIQCQQGTDNGGRLKKNKDTGMKKDGKWPSNYFYDILQFNVPTVESSGVIYDEDGQRVDTPAPVAAPTAAGESEWDMKERRTRTSIEKQVALKEARLYAATGIDGVPITDIDIHLSLAERIHEWLQGVSDES